MLDQSHDLALAVHCGDVARSGLVASILTRGGRNVSLVAEGMNFWREPGYRQVRDRPKSKRPGVSGEFAAG